MIRIVLSAVLLAAAGTAQAANDGQSQIFRQWQAMCFSGGGCEASTGDRGAASAGDTVRLIVERTSAASPGWFIALEFFQRPTRPDRAITFKVPGLADITVSGGRNFRAYRGPQRFYITAPPALKALLPAMLAGDAIEISWFDVTNESRSFNLSLSGVSASLLWIEEQMTMVGMARTAAAPTGLPEAKPPADNPIRQAGIPEAVLYFHERTSRCELYDDQELEDLGAIIEPLGPTTILYALPCTRAAYNTAYRLYVRDIGEIGGVRTLHFATFSEETNWSGTDLIFNISVNGPRLSAFYKGRGLGDCGTLGDWTWQDYDYRLERFAVQVECSGVPADKWPVIFSAAR